MKTYIENIISELNSFDDIDELKESLNDYISE